MPCCKQVPKYETEFEEQRARKVIAKWLKDLLSQASASPALTHSSSNAFDATER